MSRFDWIRPMFIKFRELVMQFRSWYWKQMCSVLEPTGSANYETSEDYVNARHRFEASYVTPSPADLVFPDTQPVNDRAPSLSIEYLASVAEQNYKSAVETFDSLDKKAEWILGASIALIGLLVVLHEKLKLEFIVIVPAVYFLFGSLRFSMACRTPMAIAIPMDVGELLDEKYRPGKYITRILSLDLSTIGTHRVTEHKATLVATAIALFVAAVVTIFIAKTAWFVVTTIFWSVVSVWLELQG